MGKVEIVQAAESLFSERGYDATSMRDIADRVGVKAASLYSHITNKQELLYIIVNTASDRFLQAIEPLGDRNDSAEARLTEVVHRHLSLMVDQLDVATIFLHERRGLSQEQHEEVLTKRRRYEHVVAQIIEDGVVSGEFDTRDTKLAATAILSILNWTYTWYRPGGSRRLEEVADFIADFVVSGVRPRRPDSRSSGTDRAEVTLQ